MNNNRCVICGAIIPDGTQVCPNCKTDVENDKPNAVELGNKGQPKYENIITDVRIDTLKDFREKYKAALKQEVNGENVDCFVESLKIFDKTLKEFINE